MTAQDHNKILAILFLIDGLLNLFALVLAVFFIVGFGVYVTMGGADAIGFWIGAVLGILICAVILVLLPFLSSFAMFKRKTWAQKVGFISAIISLLGLPLGTALGIYAIWFLSRGDAKQFYITGGEQVYMPPPQTGNWK